MVNHKLAFNNARRKRNVSANTIVSKWVVTGTLSFFSPIIFMVSINRFESGHICFYSPPSLSAPTLQEGVLHFLAERNNAYEMGRGLGNLMIADMLVVRGFSPAALWKRPQSSLPYPKRFIFFILPYISNTTNQDSIWCHCCYWGITSLALAFLSCFSSCWFMLYLWQVPLSKL